MADNIDVENLEPQPDVTADDKLWALLAYVLLVVGPILISVMEDKKNRPFIRAHHVQALVWGVLTIVLGSLLSPLSCGLSFLILWAIGIYWGWQAYQGKMVQIPYITNFVKQQGWA